MGNRKAVMVVDDDAGFLELMGFLLQSECYQVFLHGDSTTAAAEIRRQRPDLVILDLAMPEKTGWGVLEDLKAHQATQRIPVIICTAAVHEAERHRSEMLAMQVRILLKPFDVSELLLIVEQALATPAGGALATGTS